jgi:hypothetical protein
MDCARNAVAAVAVAVTTPMIISDRKVCLRVREVMMVAVVRAAR